MTPMDRARRLLLAAGLLVAVGGTAGTAWAAVDQLQGRRHPVTAPADPTNCTGPGRETTSTEGGP